MIARERLIGLLVTEREPGDEPTAADDIHDSVIDDMIERRKRMARR